MKISTILIGGALALACGCATTSGGNPQYDSLNHSAVMGVLRVPPGTSTEGANACAGLAVEAWNAEGNALVRRAQVHLSRGHCAYEITNLPSDLKLSIHVTPSPAWTCGNGSPLHLKPDTKPFSLQNYETRTLDFVAACG